MENRTPRSALRVSLRARGSFLIEHKSADVRHLWNLTRFRVEGFCVR